MPSQYEREGEAAAEFERQIEMAKNMSLEQTTGAGQEFYQNFEPLNPEERQRQQDEPVGLKNVGNSKQRSVRSSPYSYSMLLQFDNASDIQHSLNRYGGSDIPVGAVQESGRVKSVSKRVSTMQ